MRVLHGSATPIQVLLVEDNPGDVRLTQEAFEDARVHLELHVAKDGVEAMSFLLRTGNFTGAPRPDLILLDLNLPRKDGREVLAEVKAHPSLRTIPIVILTTSTSDVDVESSYLLHANCYISKPVDLDGFLTVVRSIDDFWLSVVKLPPGEAASL
jgi:chemotaxis family two-component system response regulator Rcp1